MIKKEVAISLGLTLALSTAIAYIRFREYPREVTTILRDKLDCSILEEDGRQRELRNGMGLVVVFEDQLTKRISFCFV